MKMILKMMPLNSWINVRASFQRLVLLVASGLMGACVVDQHDSLQRGPTMQDVYRGQTTAASAPDQQFVGNGRGDIRAYSRDPDNEIHQLFPTLENPVLEIYVYPHIRGELPVPGYTTAIPLYDKTTLFALPGEVLE